jgi:hypothetical protein
MQHTYETIQSAIDEVNVMLDEVIEQLTEMKLWITMNDHLAANGPFHPILNQLTEFGRRGTRLNATMALVYRRIAFLTKASIARQKQLNDQARPLKLARMLDVTVHRAQRVSILINQFFGEDVKIVNAKIAERARWRALPKPD